MALFKISKGESKNLPTTYNEGYCYVTTDDGKMYIDTSDTSDGRIVLNAGSADKLKDPKVIELTGDVTGSGLFDGTENISILTSVQDLNGYLPLTAGESKKITGPLGLTENIMYGPTKPTSGFEGQLFFVEDNKAEDASQETANYLPLSGGTLTGDLIIDNNNDSLGFIHLYGDTDGSRIDMYTPQNFTFWEISTVDESQLDISYFDTVNGEVVPFSFLWDGSFTAPKVYGAVWNDYAEFRNQIEPIEPGYCVTSTDDGKVYKTTEKFQACDGVVSDTFGFAIGKTDDCKTPLAVSGRVLVYCTGNRNDYHSGDTVCAGPDGKVMKMTREEIREYPDRIVGIVSEIPEYKTWGTGNVQINGRIWIKVK